MPCAYLTALRSLTVMAQQQGQCLRVGGESCTTLAQLTFQTVGLPVARWLCPRDGTGVQFDSYHKTHSTDARQRLLP